VVSALGAGTALVALLGKPVGESLSPRMQNAAFAARGLDWTYLACQVEAERLQAAIEGLAALGFRGANVTAPYKLDVARLVQAELPSINTLVFDSGAIRAFSTDAAVLDGLAFERAVVVGDGGAAKAFQQALPEARQFARRGDWPPDVSEADLVVHATPVKDSAVVSGLGRRHTLIDLPYPASATAEEARAAGARVLDGREVLVAQGAASFELWTGVPAPVEVMRRAVGLPGAPADDSG
jgi:shikimate dehydrogenase